MVFVLFFHLAGIIVALGAVTVIDTMGFISRKSRTWTQTTIQAHHATKPLIWIGTILMVITWFFLFDVSGLSTIKSILIAVLIVNGSFLSLYVSPRLDALKGKTFLLPIQLQKKIAVSMVVSFLSWWSVVFITVLSL